MEDGNKEDASLQSKLRLLIDENTTASGGTRLSVLMNLALITDFPGKSHKTAFVLCSAVLSFLMLPICVKPAVVDWCQR